MAIELSTPYTIGSRDPLIHYRQGLKYLLTVAFPPIPESPLHLPRALGQQAEADICRLKLAIAGIGNVRQQAAAGRFPGRHDRLAAQRYPASIDTSYETGGYGFHIALHPTDLAREEKAAPFLRLQRRLQ